MKNKYNVLDLFSGCGGLSLGFHNSGFDIKYAIDNWSVALDTLQYNHPQTKTICADISTISVKDIIDNKNIDVIIGGPPCQGFSIAGKRIIDDERNKLYKKYLDFVCLLRPRAFLMENVPNIASMGEGSILTSILNDFKEAGYYLSWSILKASDYGVPQDRRRFFLIGFKNKEQFDFRSMTKYIKNKITSKEAISDLPEDDILPEEGYPFKPTSEYQEFMRNGSLGIHNHITTKHTDKTKEIISLVPDGGDYKDLPDKYRETRKVNIAWTRLNSNKPSFTIDTGHRHHFHYKFNRVPTVRESARIQSFPDNFIFLGNKSDQEKQVGNAVPPILASTLANEMLTILG
ncbi:MAG: DNA cytosine methyltransferase [Desulforegulaceae bacterium]|nr:DNA cytosine methyltransferase [Desulforegulaceae bacterium]